jgi:hypothetical protein
MMARGDHFFVWRQYNGVPFQHHAIDLGDGTVVHFTDGDGGVAGPSASSTQFEIQRTSLDTVTRRGQDSTHVVQHPSHFPADLVVHRALSRVGRRGYHLLFDNCEHFACWCVAGREESRQVLLACERLGATSLKAIAAGTARIFSRIGTQRAVRGANPWMLAADAAQWITEAGGHHVGIRNPQHRKHAGRAVGMTTAMGVGACGGPAGVVIAGGLWAAGEFAGQMSRATYEQLRQTRKERIAD